MRLLAAALVALAAAGCASTSMKDALAAKDGGTAEVYPVAPARALEIAADVLWEATQVHPESLPDRGIVCVRGGLGDDETLVVVWVDARERAGESAVTVVSRRASAFQMASALTEDEFHRRFRERAGLVRAKEPRRE